MCNHGDRGKLYSELNDLRNLIAARVGLLGLGDPAAKVEVSLNLLNGFAMTVRSLKRFTAASGLKLCIALQEVALPTDLQDVVQPAIDARLRGGMDGSLPRGKHLALHV